MMFKIIIISLLGVRSFTEIIKMQTPPAKQPGRILGTDASAVPELVRLLREEAKVI